MIGVEFLTIFINLEFIGTEYRKMVSKWASLLPDDLERSTYFPNDDISAFPGHLVMLRGNICMNL